MPFSARSLFTDQGVAVAADLVIADRVRGARLGLAAGLATAPGRAPPVVRGAVRGVPIATTPGPDPVAVLVVVPKRTVPTTIDESHTINDSLLFRSFFVQFSYAGRPVLVLCNFSFL